ncbi:MATE family efflux transporter [Acinetobacter courvalinii]|uniref:hypothetical protein n=1 Tax=Acinetobacter courvalinii TaxID=280147 RepID=UPI0019018D88|nr:hypothetical protein [Acinetobacter courvalinii]MBJ8419816.1 hypothetical protein [Acinetobacter courvalinii]
MKDKLIMVAGIGTSKMMQLLFSFYLSYIFGHSALATFVLIVTLAAAVSSLISLGSSPQIIRAGAYAEPRSYIESVVGTAFVLSIIMIISLVVFLYISQPKFFLKSFTVNDYLISTICVSLSFILYSLFQSFLSYKQRYSALGFYSIFTYLTPFLFCILFGFFVKDARFLIVSYSGLFIVSSSIALFLSTKGEISFKRSILNFNRNNLFKKIFASLRVAIFGFITMLSLYLLIKFINHSFDPQGIAVFSVAFQFFQIGVFLPSVLGSVFVPILVRSKSNPNDQKKMKLMYILIALLWLLLSIGLVYPVFKLYGFEIKLELILTFLIVQLCVLFSSIQAFYIQNFVAAGSFGLLALVSGIWGGVLLIMQIFSPVNIIYSAVSLLIAYLISNILFAIILRKKEMKVL